MPDRSPAGRGRRVRFLAPLPQTAATYDPETRTVDVVAATGAPVERWDGLETLRIAPGAVDLKRAARMPVLWSHDHGDPIGVVRRVWIEGGRLLATIKFSETARGLEFAGMVERGELTNVSIGYRPKERRRTDDGHEITRWELLEISLVSVPADPNAHTRTLQMNDDTSQVDDLDDLDTLDDGAEDLVPPSREASRAAAAERVRASKIVSLGRKAELPGEMVRDAIEHGQSVEAFRKAAFDHMAARAKETAVDPINTHMHPPRGGRDAGRDEAIVEALRSKISGRSPAGDRARHYAGMRVDEIVAELHPGWLGRGNNRAGLIDSVMGGARSSDGWLSRGGGMHTTGDFPVLLAEALNRELTSYFEQAASPLRLLFRAGTAPDFRPVTRLRPGDVTGLSKVNEAGEIKSGSVADATLEGGTRVESFAMLLTISRSALVDDRLGFFDDVNRLLGRQAANAEATAMVETLVGPAGDGVNLADGSPLFGTGATRKNKGVAAAITVDALGDARTAMRRQLDVDGVTPLNVSPKYLLVAPEKEDEAEQFLANISAVTPETVNPYSGKMELLVEPRLSGNGWYLFADPAMWPVLEILHFDGLAQPRVEVRPGWETLGSEWRTLHEFGVGALDHRGAFRNPGA